MPLYQDDNLTIQLGSIIGKSEDGLDVIFCGAEQNGEVVLKLRNPPSLSQKVPRWMKSLNLSLYNQ